MSSSRLQGAEAGCKSVELIRCTSVSHTDIRISFSKMKNMKCLGTKVTIFKASVLHRQHSRVAVVLASHKPRPKAIPLTLTRIFSAYSISSHPFLSFPTPFLPFLSCPMTSIPFPSTHPIPSFSTPSQFLELKKDRF